MQRKRGSVFKRFENRVAVKWIVAHYRARFTVWGSILWWATVCGAAATAPVIDFFHKFSYTVPLFTFALLFTSFVFSFFFRPKVSAIRLLPAPPSAGQILLYSVIVKNMGRRPVRDLSISEGVLPRGLHQLMSYEGCCNTIDLLNPGEQATVKCAFRCDVRGIYELKPLFAGSSFPSGLLRFPRRAGGKEKLIVYPHFIPQTEFAIPFKPVYQPGGIVVSSNVGHSTEFLSTREYRQGDRLRDIHWPSSARTGKLIVKEYLDEYFVRVGIFLDTELTRRETGDSFEMRVSLTAGIADAIAKREYIIDLFVAGERFHHFQMGRALAHLENLLELLACIESVQQVDFTRILPPLQSYLEKLSTMIVLLRDWDDARQRFCRLLEMAGSKIKILVIRDGPLTLSPKRSLTVVPATGEEPMLSAG